MKNGMQPGDYFHSIVHMAHVAACSAKATATATFGEKAARPISCLGQLLNAIDHAYPVGWYAPAGRIGHIPYQTRRSVSASSAS